MSGSRTHTVTPVRLEPAAPQSRVKQSTSEPLCSPGHLVQMLITVNLHGIFGSNYAFLLFYYCPATDMQNGDEESPSIILVGRGLFSENAHNS